MYNYTVTQIYTLFYFFTRGLKPGTQCITYPYYHLVPLKVQPQYFLFCKDRYTQLTGFDSQFAVWAIQISCCKPNLTDSSQTHVSEIHKRLLFSARHPSGCQNKHPKSDLMTYARKQLNVLISGIFWLDISVIKSMVCFSTW